MSDRRHAAAREQRRWRARYKDVLVPTEATKSLRIEEMLLSGMVPAGEAPGDRHANYPEDGDEENVPGDGGADQS